MALTREQILARKTVGRPPVKFTLPDGEVILIRGMTHGESFQARTDDPDERYDYMIHFGLVEPKLSLEDARAWRQGDDAGVIESVCHRVMELSGLAEGAGKSGVPSAG
jgi:hypothetical protein